MRDAGPIVLWVLVAVAGCGGSSETTTTTSTRDTTSGREREEREDSSTQITGLLGTIRPEQVDDTMQRRMPQLARCLETRMRTVAFLGGDVRLAFHIRTDGTVAWVYPEQSTFGDREAERCILDLAAHAHFPHPRGGEAEFTWGFGIDPPEEVRLPLAWDEGRIAEVLEANAPQLRSQCGRGGFRVTAYVAPGGRVLAAGASAPDADALAAIDCVVTGVLAWSMPDPGSYAAKVSFDLD